MNKYGKVAVVFGGTSAEREVSIMSGTGVLNALQSRDVDAHAFDPKDKPLSVLKEEGFNRAFLILHGPGGEDGTIQGALDCLNIPYTGCGVMASAIGMDKLRTKLLWRALGLPIPAFELLDEHSDFAAVEDKLGLPLFVKPATEGSSIGVIKVKTKGELKAAFEEARKYDRLVLAEQFIGGGEYTAPVLGDAVKGYNVLPMIKIEPATEFYDYQAKYFRDDTVYRCPCGLTPAQEAEIAELVKQAFWAIGGESWARVDFLMDEAGNPYLLEVNTAPGMTSHSLFPMGAKAAGMSYEDLVLSILDTTLKA
ncbi:D-alanine--D-alanine ligase [Chitinimonas sp. BJB300]|uniref:D-alanine--D-alanine ligase n=1 Tax=Chitinimonas sp. BJB300 TaxID=1559339 RepID=UPI000C0EDD93|nr:D-alanine--D-alanine ligase [Chitinimonas sp. BJB300]PHV12774.1 D-alanine--D-alanine ligase [Chitinimonas sp. BJB300]TSJ91356.1 D-alanine--D-alanine ligase [Chitinimonas sp. BJB300]